LARQRKQRSGKRGRRNEEKPKGFILSIQDGRQRGEEYHFEEESTLGRIDENSIVIIDDSISRQHARVWGKRGVFLAEDLGSSNGTRINGKIIVEPEVLKDGDYLTVGTVNLMFSNLDVHGAGEPTVIINLTDKQKEKLDYETSDLTLQERAEELWAIPAGKYGIIGTGIFLLFLLYLGISALFIDKTKKKRIIKDNSEQVVYYQESEWRGFLGAWFGYCSLCERYTSSLKLGFNVAIKNTRVVLTYAAAMIEKDREVEILLNGKRIAYAEWAPPRRPKYNFVLDIYRAAKNTPGVNLKIGDNILEFRNTINFEKKKKKAKKERWALFYIRIKTTALPKPNPETAAQEYKNAKERFEQRELATSNTAVSISKFNRVIDLLELADLEKPEFGQFKAMYRDSLRTLVILNRELDSFFETNKGVIQEIARIQDSKVLKRNKSKIRQELKRFPEEDLRKIKLLELMKEYFR
jgi:FHA domain